MHYYLLLICLLPMAMSHYYMPNHEHHHGHHHGHYPEHHHGHHHGHHHEHHNKSEIQITTTTTEKNTENPTHEMTILTDREDLTCKCVPYYLCGDANNASVTGYGMLDQRSNAFFPVNPKPQYNPYQDRMELCCEPELVKPEPSKLGSSKLDPSKSDIPKPDSVKLKNCGFRNQGGLDFNLTGITGKEALFGEFPWVVGILDNNIYYGGGALIHAQVVITAAHVVLDHTLGRLKIRAGEWDTTTTKERLGYQEQLVKEVYTNGELVRPGKANNIALLLLEQPLQLDEHINVICMPDPGEDFSKHKECVANGWGKEAYNGPKGEYAKVLKRVEIDMVEHSRCETLLRRYLGGAFSLHSSFVCAGGEEGKDTCEGDGGGPLACPIGNDRYKLTGLVVAGVGCGKKDVPAVYSDVARFRRWVDNKMAAWGLTLNSTAYIVDK